MTDPQPLVIPDKTKVYTLSFPDDRPDEYYLSPLMLRQVQGTEPDSVRRMTPWADVPESAKSGLIARYTSATNATNGLMAAWQEQRGHLDEPLTPERWAEQFGSDTPPSAA